MVENSLPTIGRYQLKSKLGEGSMALVARAYDPKFKRDVAMKILHRRYNDDTIIRQRFLREAHTIARLEHPAIVPIYDTGTANGYSFMVMRLMPGGTLLDQLEKGPLPAEEIARILERVGAALDAAHARGIVHRDVKPDNIMFDQYGQAYLSDFGIVRMVEGDPQRTGDTLIGTPAYMSPEQVTGESEIDGRSDLYSLGAVLFEMITGELPYEGDTAMQMATQHVLQPVPRLRDRNPSLPKSWERVIAKAMAKDKRERYQTGAELAAAFVSAASQGRASLLMPLPPLRHNAGKTRRRWVLPLIVGALLLLFLGWGLWSVFRPSGTISSAIAVSVATATVTPTPTVTSTPTEEIAPTLTAIAAATADYLADIAATATDTASMLFASEATRQAQLDITPDPAAQEREIQTAVAATITASVPTATTTPTATSTPTPTPTPIRQPTATASPVPTSEAVSATETVATGTVTATPLPSGSGSPTPENNNDTPTPTPTIALENIGRIIYTSGQFLMTTDPESAAPLTIGPYSSDSCGSPATLVDGLSFDLYYGSRCNMSETITICNSPNGQYELLIDGRDLTNLLSVRPAGSDDSGIPIYQGDLDRNEGIRWSPLSTGFLFVVGDSVHFAYANGGYDLIISIAYQPLFSPDGSMVLYRAPVAPSVNDIFVVGVDGSNPRNVTNISTVDKRCAAWRQ